MADPVSVYPLFTRNQAFPPTASGGGVTNVDQCHLAVAYDGSVLQMQAWMEREGSISAATSCTITWYDEDGNQVFTQNSTSADPQAHFLLTQAQTLLTNHAYYAIVTMVDGLGSITTHRGVPTTA